MPRKLKGSTQYGWTIFNHTGSPWTVQCWPYEKQAQAYLEERRKEWEREGWGSLNRHSVQRVRVVMSPAPEGED